MVLLTTTQYHNMLWWWQTKAGRRTSASWSTFIPHLQNIYLCCQTTEGQNDLTSRFRRPFPADSSKLIADVRSHARHQLWHFFICFRWMIVEMRSASATAAKRLHSQSYSLTWQCHDEPRWAVGVYSNVVVAIVFITSRRVAAAADAADAAAAAGDDSAGLFALLPSVERPLRKVKTWKITDNCTTRVRRVGRRYNRGSPTFLVRCNVESILFGYWRGCCSNQSAYFGNVRNWFIQRSSSSYAGTS